MNLLKSRLCLCLFLSPSHTKACNRLLPACDKIKPVTGNLLVTKAKKQKVGKTIVSDESMTYENANAWCLLQTKMVARWILVQQLQTSL